MVNIIVEPRWKLLRDLRSWSGVRDAREVGAVYPWGSEIMLVHMREGQRELQRECRKREIRSASPGEGPCRYHLRRRQGVDPFQSPEPETTAIARTHAMAAWYWPITLQWTRKIWRSRGYECPAIQMLPLE